MPELKFYVRSFNHTTNLKKKDFEKVFKDYGRNIRCYLQSNRISLFLFALCFLTWLKMFWFKKFWLRGLFESFILMFLGKEFV